ncbi:zincin [Dendrothele bispora CBS 962.96]|uniref:Zincin n=1 Tax=Dendrothele bispora (strain CBS 962.96) TaxID=1314807 RepID=A0A4S8MSD1_DENBC|nr:zincin [Dendrothele bispora CBS 962.96]
MASLVPPQPAPKWSHTPSQIKQITEELISQNRKLQDAIAALPDSSCDFKTVFLALADADTQFDAAAEPLAFYQNTSPDKELRDASNESESQVRAFGVESSMRRDVFAVKVAAEKNLKASGEWDKLNAEEKRLVEKMVILDGKRAGLALDDDKRQQLTTLKTDLSKTCLEFSKNFNEEDGRVTFTLEELDGVPADVVNGYTKRTESGKDVYDVTFKTPDIFPLFKYAKNPETRRRAFEAYESRLEINVPILSKALDLRRQIASILGYKTWADYITEEKMIKNAQGVINFLDNLESKLGPVGKQDLKNLMVLKEKEYKSSNLPFDDKFYIWDYRYYDRKFIEETLELDDSAVKEYFPVDHVVPTILNIYQDLLGVKFVAMKDEEGATWHPEVQRFSVWEKDAKDESGFVGYCYLDLYPRANKYSHAAVWPLLPGYTTTALSPHGPGKRSYPIAAMVANLAKPPAPSSDPNVKSKPALMRHDDVVTFFHEMGHVFHGLLSKTQFARFHGTSVARDFVEAPSQMLENWCWEKSVLKVLGKHWEKGESMSDDMIDRLIKSRYVNVGLFYLRQIFFAKYDIKVHTDSEPTDYTKLWNDLREEVSLVKSGKPCPGQGTFGHITGGYDAGYYGYTYSLVFAADMYSTVFKADPLDPARGQRYRDKILVPGGSREELDSLKDFLGREPDSEAFIKEIFGNVPPTSASL